MSSVHRQARSLQPSMSAMARWQSTNLNAELAFVLEKDKQEIKDIIHDML